MKATQAGRWGKVKALQWMLTHSFSGKALAVNRVTENKGKNTAGVDGAIWQSYPTIRPTCARTPASSGSAAGPTLGVGSSRLSKNILEWRRRRCA